MDAITERHGKLATERESLIFEKAEASIKVVAAISQLRELQMSSISAEVLQIEAISDLETLKERNEDVRNTLKAKEDEETAAIAESARLMKEAQSYADAVRQLVNEKHRTPGLAEFVDSIRSEMTAEELEAMIDSEKAAMELIHVDSSRNIVKEYEDRQKNIDRIRGRLQSFLEKQDEINHAITEIRQVWEPRLDKLIRRISDAFSDSFARIGCAGQVTVYKASAEDVPAADNTNNPNNPHASNSNLSSNSTSNLHRSRSDNPPPSNAASSDENNTGNGLDFSSWALHIHVTFRESEPLSLLDSHRQSGGERAVSTIFYLMALQSLSRAPFRVVDEINQGMDPRNERMVHGRLVDMACAEDGGNGGGGGQYFLITPKLLSGLRYRRRMKVLCIVSGEKMPSEEAMEVEGEEGGAGGVDFRAWVERARRLGMGAGGKRVDSGAYMGSDFEDRNGVGSEVEVGA